LTSLILAKFTLVFLSVLGEVYSSLKRKPMIANVKFDYVYQNDRRNQKGETQEIDILLENGSSVAVVEVKNRVSQKSIDQLDKIMERFDYFHPLYKDYTIIGAIAGKIFPKHLQEQTLSKGYSVITQQGDHMELLNP
jgi:DNA-binding sugar fermentation-stimulating protein